MGSWRAQRYCYADQASSAAMGTLNQLRECSIWVVLGGFLLISAGTSALGHKQWVLTERDNHKTVNVSVGDTVLLKLNVFSGSVWRARYSAGLSEVSGTYFERKQRTGKLGGPEVQVFKFIVLGVGSQDLQLSHHEKNKISRICTFQLQAH